MLQALKHKILTGEEVSYEEVLPLTRLEKVEIYDLFCVSGQITQYFRGNEVELCSIINARSGRCSENCIFCAQSVYYDTDVHTYPMLEPGKIVEKAKMAEQSGTAKFSIVTSGKGLSGSEFETVLKTLQLLRQETNLELCASLGVIDEVQALKLKEAGLSNYHHNLETAPSYFENVCTTHSINDRISTIEAAQNAGLRVCSGGIFNLGESMEQRLELAFELRKLKVDSIPLNFLNPIPATPLEDKPQLPPLSYLQTISLFRFILPGAILRLCGGRKEALGQMLPLAFFAGANGLMIGDYLTTKGEAIENDLQLLKDLGKVRPHL